MSRGDGCGEGEIERGREGGVKNNGVFRGLVFWVLTSQLVCVCVCVCVCVLHSSLNVMTVF